MTTCYPVLIGDATPTGTFTLIERVTDQPGYGGNVLQFYETDSIVYSIHRLWLLNPEQHRQQRINSTDPRDRVITKGCVNVEPKVFDMLRQCCINQQLRIEE